MSANRTTAAACKGLAALVLCAGSGDTANEADDTTAPEPERDGGEAGR